MLDDVLHCSNYTQKFPDVDRLVPYVLGKDFGAGLQVSPLKRVQPFLIEWDASVAIPAVGRLIVG